MKGKKKKGDFSEKYKTAPVKLTPEAKEVLLNYEFPGNIRQLKNIVEQISVLEMNKLISAEVLENYLPKSTPMFPILYEGNKEENMSERDILYKVLFEMKKDVTDLKKLVNEIINNDGEIHPHMLESHKSLLEPAVVGEKPSRMASDTSLVIDMPASSDVYPVSKVEDISHELEADESLSIEKKEQELIIKALRKNHNKRKYAAQDLGISERTLYRKIKQYEIED